MVALGYTPPRPEGPPPPGATLFTKGENGVEILIFQILRSLLPAHVYIELEEFEPAPPHIRLDDPMPDAPVYDKPMWSIEYIGLPPFWDYTGNTRPLDLTNPVRRVQRK